MAATAIARIDIQTGNAVRKLQQLGKASKNLAQKVGGAASKIGGLQGVLGRLALAETGRRMVSMAATFKQTELRLKLLSQEHGEFAKAQELAARAGKKFGLGQTEALQGITDIYARLRPLGTSLKDIESTYVGFNTVAKLSGVNAMQASAAFTQLAQALGSGRLQGDEFRSIAEQVPGLLTAVAEETGKSVGELKAFASQGKLTSDILIKALKKVEKDGAGKIASIMKDDPTQKFKNLQNAIETLSIVIGNDLLPAVTPIIEAMTKVVLIATKLPGPIKTAGAAVIGFGAAFLIAAPGVAQIVGGIKVMSAVIMAKLVPALIAANVAGGPWVLLLSGIAAGLTYFILKELNIPVSPQNHARLAGVEMKYMLKFAKRLGSVLGKPYVFSNQNVNGMVTGAGAKLINPSQEYIGDVQTFANYVEQKYTTVSKRFSRATLAACFYIVSLVRREHYTQERISEITQVSEVGLRNHVKSVLEILNIKKADLDYMTMSELMR